MGTAKDDAIITVLVRAELQVTAVQCILVVISVGVLPPSVFPPPRPFPGVRDTVRCQLFLNTIGSTRPTKSYPRLAEQRWARQR